MINRRGSVLAMVVIISSVLFLLTGVVYTLFKMNASASIFRMNRIRSEVAAEAGVALAIHHLASLETRPEGGDPFFIPMAEDSSGWIQIPGGQSFLVVIDPVNSSGGAFGNGSVEIRSRGVSGNVSRDVYVRAAPSYPSSYCLLTDNGIPSGTLVDRRVFNGPVHSNGTIYFTSYSPDSTDDPWVDMISTTVNGGFYLEGFGRSDVAHPEGSNIWVRPYSRMSQGPPYWTVNAPQIDFGRMQDHFRGLTGGTLPQNAVSVSGERILIEGDRVFYKANESSPESVADISDADLLVVRNGFHPVMVKTIRMPGHPLTVLSTGDMLIGGGIDGGAVGSGGPFGLVSLGNMIIAADPDETGAHDWSGRWQIETDRSLLIRASVCIPGGSLSAQVPYVPENLERITVSGSVTQRDMGRLSSVNSGYELGISWDQGLGAMHPPHFPMLGRWNIYSWLFDPPGRGDTNIEDDMV